MPTSQCQSFENIVNAMFMKAAVAQKFNLVFFFMEGFRVGCTMANGIMEKSTSPIYLLNEGNSDPLLGQK